MPQNTKVSKTCSKERIKEHWSLRTINNIQIFVYFAERIKNRFSQSLDYVSFLQDNLLNTQYFVTK